MTGSIAELGAVFDRGVADGGLARLYGTAAIEAQKRRYRKLLATAAQRLPQRPAALLRAPGRTELGGNHTDHNNGRVLASAVDLDCVAVVAATEDGCATLYSTDYQEPIRVDLGRLAPQPAEAGTPQALVRGVAAARNRGGRPAGGFAAVIDATCRPGTGLSSSAAFSVLTGAAFAYCAGDLTPDPVDLARDGQTAENEFFAKPCGLMDQIASAVGTTVAIDFANPDDPAITRLNPSFDASGYRLVIIDTGSGHGELTPAYAAVFDEITACARLLGRARARGVDFDRLLDSIDLLRSEAGDRAVLRLLHFIAEDERAARQTEALQADDFSRYLELVAESGESSCQLLQNCATPDSRDQGILLARALTRQFFSGAVCRVHGGGFAGTVQTYVPDATLPEYRRFMERVFGRDAVLEVLLGRPGVCRCGRDGWQIGPAPEA